jgi:hypothetical protein
VEIQSKLPKITLGNSDRPVWNSCRGSYSFAEAWESLREKQPEVPWWKLVWFSMAISKLAGLFFEMLLQQKRRCLVGALVEN